MTTQNEKVLGTKFAGFGNTVPMMGGNGKYGVWNVLLNNWAPNTPWDNDADRVIELFDEMTMATASGKKVKKNGQPKVKVINRERGGEKSEIAKEICENYAGKPVKSLIILCAAKMPGVSDANWRYLIDKVQGRR